MHHGHGPHPASGVAYHDGISAPPFSGLSSPGFVFCVGHKYARRWLSNPQLQSQVEYAGAKIIDGVLFCSV